jgi:hypothetical protein
VPNGKPHDHPLTDILVHNIPAYGEEADNLIRKIADLCSHREMSECGHGRSAGLQMETWLSKRLGSG